MSQKITEALQIQFNTQDVIFWYDQKNEFLELLENLQLKGVDIIHVQNNQFEIKYIVTNKLPEQKFLLYFNTSKPEHHENWLLDLELAYHTFHTDQEAILLQELGLDFHFKELLEQHRKFFDAKERVEKLKELLGKGDTHNDIRAKMLAVTFNSAHVDSNTFVLVHATAFADNNEKLERDLTKYNLVDFYWETLKERFNYKAEEPKIYDFLIEAFSTSLIVPTRSKLKNEVKYVLSIWKDMLSYREGFNTISGKVAADLQIEQLLNEVSIESIIDEDLFQLTDKKIIHELVQRLLQDNISNETLQTYIKARENKFWYHQYQAFYQCVSFASQLQDQIKLTQYQFYSLKDGLSNYTKSHYKVDYFYRKFIFWYRATTQNSILNELAQSLEKLYTNNWLLPYNNQWQKVVDGIEEWPVKESFSQRQFFKQHIQPYVDKNQRVFIIISDALRYECGKELTDVLVKENRYEASIEGAIASLPSYTQLGMASLLPHTNLEIEKETENIRVDGLGSIGINGRSAILKKNTTARATAIKADDFMKLNAKTDGRDFVKQFDVIYIYHNKIDKTGDDTTSEDQLVEAVEDELLYIKEVLKKIANMNGNNMIVTADHGFLYQYQTIAESDFMKVEKSKTITKLHRRFILGENTNVNDSLKKFTHSQLGLQSKGGIMIPKSINRLRVNASSSKFVHGGASLQEIITPIIKVNKKRLNTTEQVEVDIIKSTDKITTNLLAVSFIQTEAVNKSKISRTLKVVIVAEDETELSDVFTYTFDSEDENQRQREVKHRFHLTALASGKYKNQRVKLILKEPMERSNKWKIYKEYYYTLNISFTNDFDGF